MQVKILGSAAGGGFPQWNCACTNCRMVRIGKFAGRPRAQAQVAVSPDGRSWFLLGASPDLRIQIEKSADLHPKQGTRRGSPFAGVILSCAELDHVLGLLHLRELQPFTVYATPSVTSILREQNTMFRMLNRVPDQVIWQNLHPGDEFSLTLPSGEEAGLDCRAIPISDRYPSYVCRPDKLNPGDATIGLILTSKNGRSLGYFPGVGTITEELLKLLQSLDLLLFDGTFWSEDELIQLRGSGQSAHDMGHIPVGGEFGSLRQLAGLRSRRKLYIHINNTNPMLNEAGPEYRAVRDAGWDLAEDGCQVTL
jgi:pyrroloquinoline quinone biosynthesis protein B